MDISGIDHFVLTVKDVDATLAFYERVLGMEVVVFSEGRKALKFGSQKINLHQAGKEFEPKAHHPTRGSGDYCLVSRTPLKDVMNSLQKEGVDLIEGPVETTGAHGKMTSIYYRDPDLNLVEISNYA